MKTADELFEELGYEKEVTTWKEDGKEHYINYKTDDTAIEFTLDSKDIYISNLINMQELKAINQFCKEKGWLDE